MTQNDNLKLSRTTRTHPPTNSHRDKSNLDEPPIANFEAELQERMLDLTTIPGKRISGWHQGPGIDAGRSLSQGPNGGSKVPARVPQGPKRPPSGPCWVDSGPECQSGKGVATARGSSGPGDRSFIISQGLERPRRELRMTFNQRRSLGILWSPSEWLGGDVECLIRG